MEQETTMNIENIIAAAIGPGGTVIVCLLIGYALYQLFNKHLLPMHKSTIQNLIDSHERDRAEFINALGKLEESASKDRDVNRHILTELGNMHKSLEKLIDSHDQNMSNHMERLRETLKKSA